ncbi:phosphopantetheine-binding protein [Streptomyces himastatinicus ATCC 53653]|uniref:Phosphopantetheine-binding protein n=1 Tax=Streptomyces himastatinicus ATCC 53653 TaxID=457427 RepID=D9WQH3_9ACTN|nr:acyl carrier protein [Streptomyces himastatinicus]EFL28106.1 phosphopantetheine-binding protein [Streptomyces himastatinicus ATCC 53653]
MTSSTSTTTVADITRTVTEVVAEILDRPVDALSPDADLRGVEGADSIKVVRIIAKIEQTFDIELEDDEIFGINTIGEVVALVERATARERS